MSTSIPGGSATPLAGWPGRTRSLQKLPSVTSRMARALWLRDRGVAELRGAAITLTTMALLGAGSMYFDPASGDFDRVVKLATPLAIILALIAWSPAARGSADRAPSGCLLGPLVVVVAILGCGVGDVATLQLPPAGPLIPLAMAFAAMTPGYPLAAAIVTGTSLAILLAHSQVVAATGLGAHVADEFTIGFIVTLLASGRDGLRRPGRHRRRGPRDTAVGTKPRTRRRSRAASTGSSPGSMARSRSAR